VTQPLVQFTNLDASLSQCKVLHDLSWQLRPGENWAVLGGNGAGKSTFLRLLRGDLWPDPNCGTRTYGFNGRATSSPIRAKEQFALVSAEQQTKYRRKEWSLSGAKRC
jgi:molybdate transport system ATP-binding protein